MRAGAEPESLDEMWTRAWDRRGWPAGGRGAATVLALFAAQRMLTNRIDRALRPAGLTLARFEVLAVLAHADGRPVHVTGLADALQVHPTSVSSALDRLEGDGLVERAVDPDDARRILVRLTDHGRDRLDGASSTLRADVLGDLGLTRSDTATLIRVLGSLRANAGDFVPATAAPRARSA
ncbi:MAG: MarR family transcriptional regulator [Candidatus Nanopelagicales bacterium]|jgi:DNA-binding MarR family transcriptional regulator